SASDTPLAGGTIDSKYLLEKKLGEGGMGAVWRALHIFMAKPVALKLLRRAVADSDEAVRRFALEAKLASQLDDPHCVTVHDCGRDPQSGALYLAMEYLEGKSLRALLGTSPRLPLHRAADVLWQLLAALGAAHDLGIVHRDVKPENVFLITHRKRQDFVKLLDFGVAKQPPQEAPTPRGLTTAGCTAVAPQTHRPHHAP